MEGCISLQGPHFHFFFSPNYFFNSFYLFLIFEFQVLCSHTLQPLLASVRGPPFLVMATFYSPNYFFNSFYLLQKFSLTEFHHIPDFLSSINFTSHQRQTSPTFFARGEKRGPDTEWGLEAPEGVSWAHLVGYNFHPI